MRAASSVFLLALVLAVDARAATPKPRNVHWVDVRRALLSTVDGLKVAEELDAEHARTEAELSALEGALAAMQKDFLAAPSKAKIAAYEAKAAELEEALIRAEARLTELETKKVAPLAEDIRSFIRGLNDVTKDALILEIDRYQPLSRAAKCDATDWVVTRMEKPGKKPLKKHRDCAVRFFLYVDLARFKTEMKGAADAQQELEVLREERLQEIPPAGEETRFAMYLRYSEIEKSRRAREQKSFRTISRHATNFIADTALKMKGVLFLGAKHDRNAIQPSCEVTKWMVELEHGIAAIEDVARDCPCVWLGERGRKLRIARSCPAH